MSFCINSFLKMYWRWRKKPPTFGVLVSAPLHVCLCICVSVFASNLMIVHRVSTFFLFSILYAAHMNGTTIISMSQQWTLSQQYSWPNHLYDFTVYYTSCNIYISIWISISKPFSVERWWTSELWNGHSWGGKMITLSRRRFVWTSQSHERCPIESIMTFYFEIII